MVKKKKTRPKFKKPSSIKRRVQRITKTHSFIPPQIIEAFARTPEAAPKERRRGHQVRPIRSALNENELRQLFEAQDGRCKYCELPFGYLLYKEDDGTKYITLEITKDHFKPYSRYRDNSKEIIVLACQLCNGYKSDKVFKTPEDVGDFTRERMRRAGYAVPRSV